MESTDELWNYLIPVCIPIYSNLYIDLICIIYIYTYAVYLDFHTWLGVVIVYPLYNRKFCVTCWLAIQYRGSYWDTPKAQHMLLATYPWLVAKQNLQIGFSPLVIFKLTMFGFGPYISSISPYFTSSWVQIPHRLHDKGNPPFRFLVRWFSQP